MANKANPGAVWQKPRYSRADKKLKTRAVWRITQALVMMALVSGARVGTADEPPMARFKDVTAEAGIQFVHVNGAYGEKLLPVKAVKASPTGLPVFKWLGTS